MLLRYEFTLRKVFSFKYYGNKYLCQVCNATLKTFVKIHSNDLLCPFCGSLSRTRRLSELLKENQALNGNILHFSPSRSLYRNFKKLNSIHYYSSDFADEFVADHHFDITKIDLQSDFFDTIICYHILEHIEDDQKAMKELYRVLKTDGKCYIQTPFKKGKIYEDDAIIGKAARLKAFGQDDHVRIYSINGLKMRLENKGFNILLKTFQPQENDSYFGLRSPETVLICTKSKS